MKCGMVAKAWRSGMTGMAGNFRVASELLLRGLNVSIPAVDTGVDLEAEGIVKLQVKSSHMMKRGDGYQPSYNFNLSRGPRMVGVGRMAHTTARIFSETCHFVVLWGIEQNRFWVVPAAMLDSRMTIYLGPEGRWIATDGEQIESMLESGMNQRDIAASLNISEMTVSRRVRKIFATPSPTIAEIIKIRECEGRWDHIQSYVNAMRELDHLIVPQRVPVSLGSDGEGSGFTS